LKYLLNFQSFGQFWAIAFLVDNYALKKIFQKWFWAILGKISENLTILGNFGQFFYLTCFLDCF